MTKFTCELTKPSNTIIFHNSEKQVGLLDFNGPVMTFEGDADESAKVLFDFIADRFAQRMSENREWVGLSTDEILSTQYCYGSDDNELCKFAAAIEAKLEAKNR